MFRLGAVDNDIDLIAVYANEDAPRSVGVGTIEDLDDMLSCAYDISLERLMQHCKEVDEVWSQSTHADRIADKNNDDYGM